MTLIPEIAAASVGRLVPMPVSPVALADLRNQYGRRRNSPWASPGHPPVTPIILPDKFGDGEQIVLVSFYAAPELCIAVAFDSGLPLDLDLAGRCTDSPVTRCFRDVIDEVYDALIAYFEKPPISLYRKKDLYAEVDPEDRADLDLWKEIIRHGSTWCLA